MRLPKIWVKGGHSFMDRFKLQLKSVLIAGLLSLFAVAPLQAQSQTDNQSDISSLISRQQQRTDMLENSVKDIRGTIEREFMAIRKEVEGLAALAVAEQSGSSSDFKSLQAKLATLADNIDVASQRISNALNLYSDIEFRVLRLEQRLNTLLSLSGDDIANQMAQQDVTGTGASPSVSLSRDKQTGETVWTIEKDKLDAQLSPDNQSNDQSNAADSADTIKDSGESRNDNASIPSEGVAAATGDNMPQASDQASQIGAEANQDSSASPKILPDASTEDQFRFALTRALQNDLETAEQAFMEFNALYPEHERSSDSLFWLGRVQFIQGQFEKSATTFSKFNALYSSDPRLPDTTLWIAESVSKFASPEQACEIYANLAKFLDNPPASFTDRLNELSAGANCSS
jgi:TolA-binding protein